VTLGELLARAALRRPEAEAVVDGQRRLTYAELDKGATAVAAGLRRLGVGRGDRVLLALRNRLEHVVAYWGLQKLGGVAVPVNVRLAAGELRYLLDDSGARVALCEASTVAAVREAAAGTSARLVFVGDPAPADSIAFADLLAAGDELTEPGGEPRGENDLYTFSVFPDVRVKPGCADRAELHSTLRVVVASAERRVGPDELVPPSVKGEIVASLASDKAFAGYWNRPDADARALREGWYFTGDMGWVDADGDLWVAGRVDDMIISGGENIYPVEIEEVLARHALVRDVAVIGEPDEKWGERVVAFVVPATGLTAEALDGHCRASDDLANFKRPRRFVFVSEIPKTASGKLLRRLLRDGHYTEVRP